MININYKFKIYLIIINLIGIFFLIQKFNVGNDSTISEWIINYHGGFTKRGIIGELVIFFANIFELKLRTSILIFQIILISSYYFLIYLYFKDLKLNRLMVFSIFTPIFLFYPISEIEVLARKELFIFIIYIFYLYIDDFKYHLIYKLTVLPLGILIWEPMVFFLGFFVFVDVIKFRYKYYKQILTKIFFPYLPLLFISFYIALNPMGEANHSILVNYLSDKFGEVCYMSCDLLNSKSTIIEQFKGHSHLISFEVSLRYFLIIIIGYGPLFFLAFKSELKDKNLFFLKYFKNLFFPFLIFWSPAIVLFLMGSDWGRWVNIGYFFPVIFYFFLFKNNLININPISLDTTIGKKVFIAMFIIYAFGWSPKTSITGDIGSFPGYRVPYKVLKISYNKYIKTNF